MEAHMTAIIICTRTDSERLPNKPFRKINGTPLIEHLIKRLQKVNIPIIIAFPREQKEAYSVLKGLENVILHPSKLYGDPLRRMNEAAMAHDVDTVIRVSHDKILVNPADVDAAILDFQNMKLEYLYGSKFTPGTGFEIIGIDALQRAAKKFKNVEYIGYSVRSVTPKENIYNFNPRHQRGGFRFLIDYEQDLKLFEVLLSQLGDNLSLLSAMKYLADNPEIKEINKMPVMTVYTCAHNAEEWIERCMDSVARQKHFSRYEYILIDDHSKDKTLELMAKFALKYPNVSWSRNGENLGLSSSSNIALKKARGKYILRLDADDYFVSTTALDQMLKAISESEKDAIYPNNYFGSLNTIQNGKEKHHVGGAIFDKDAINHIKFTDGLSNHDSLDIFLRAKSQLDIGYLQKAMFFYYQHGKSMSKTNLANREEIKEKLLTKWARDDFYDEDDEVDFKELGVDIEPSH
jgi:spore coat polysaccharide biosynthesis protein SpsF (cytidylyltransferase family)